MISGRGVGLDVVRANVERIGGSVGLHSVPGEGTTLRMRVPLTLAIVPALIAHCGGQVFAVPHSTLLEMVVVMKQDEAASIQRIGNTKMYLLRNRLIPLLDLSEVLGVASNHVNGFYIAILEAKGRQFGLIVDDMAEPQEIVVKPLSHVLRGLNLYSGATLLGDGKIALILDTTALARSAKLCEAGENAAAVTSLRERSVSAIGGADQRAGIPMLVFADHRREPAVVPLDCVERIEKVLPEAVERLAGQGVLQYRGELVTLEDAGGLLQEQGSSSGVLLVLICRRPRGRGQRVGLVVREVLDVAEGEVLPPSASRRGMAARVNGRLAMFCAGFEVRAGEVKKGDRAIDARANDGREDLAQEAA